MSMHSVSIHSSSLSYDHVKVQRIDTKSVLHWNELFTKGNFRTSLMDCYLSLWISVCV